MQLIGCGSSPKLYRTVSVPPGVRSNTAPQPIWLPELSTPTMTAAPSDGGAVKVSVVVLDQAGKGPIAIGAAGTWAEIVKRLLLIRLLPRRAAKRRRIPNLQQQAPINTKTIGCAGFEPYPSLPTLSCGFLVKGDPRLRSKRRSYQAEERVNASAPALLSQSHAKLQSGRF